MLHNESDSLISIDSEMVNRIPYVLLMDDDLSSGLYGKQLIKCLDKMCAEMNTCEEPVSINPRDDHHWTECLHFVRQGNQAGEPEMMFLFAELFRYYRYGFDRGNNYMEYVDANHCNGADEYIVGCDFFTEEEKEFPSAYWYRQAALAGSKYAMLWCAYCMEEGINGFKKDPIVSQEILDSMPELPKTLGQPELSSFTNYPVYLREKIEFLSYIEDLERMNPGSFCLNYRYLMLCTILVKLGQPHGLGYRSYYHVTMDMDYGYELTSAYVESDKKGLLAWCQKKAMDIHLV